MHCRRTVAEVWLATYKAADFAVLANYKPSLRLVVVDGIRIEKIDWTSKRTDEEVEDIPTYTVWWYCSKHISQDMAQST